MIALLIAAQLASSATAALPDTTVYATAALRAMVEQAAISNRLPPPTLGGYRVGVESELAFVVRDTLGRERVAQAEQVAGRATWTRRGGYDLNIVGYRQQTLGVPMSALSLVRNWTLPTLYGDRLLLGIERSGATGVRVVRRGARSDTVVAVHPLAADRERFYRYSGGDTVAILRSQARSIPVTRIRVEPRPDALGRFAGFDGEIHLDASRHQIVRMRGRFVERADRPGNALSRLTSVEAVAFVEFVNAEVGGEYWLPSYQRIEFQAMMALLGEMRSIFRVVSRFSGYDVETSADQSLASVSHRREVTFAPSGTLDAFRDWTSELGATTASVSADDFAELAPPSWRPGGPPVWSLRPTRFDRMVHFNRVEGLYTGMEGSVDFRDAIPGLVIRADAGWAWSEATARGGVSVARSRGGVTVGGRAERRLEHTNDFLVDYAATGASLSAMFGSVDDFDYVDRVRGAVFGSRLFGSVQTGLVTAQLGWGRDAAARARLEHGWVPGPEPFRANRGAAEGSYGFGALEYEYRPDVSADFIQPGLGARLRYEGAAGELAWHRVEGTASVRRYLGPLSLALRGDAGVVLGGVIPPQQLFELGGREGLPGYDYKEFAGDQAALFRGFANYALPFQRAPYRFGRIFIPGLAPGIGGSVQGGITRITTAAARDAVRALGAGWAEEPVSGETNGVRATVGGGLTLFSGAVHVGVARPIDRPAPWRWVFGFGSLF
jgi:hypothetical protein